MTAPGPCDYKLKLYGRGRASDALIQHRITALGYEIYNCAGNSRLVRNKVPALQALREKFMEALRTRAAASSEESDNSDTEETPTLAELERKVSAINHAGIKNRRDRAFCHYQIARLEAEIGALHDAQDYYRNPWFRSTDEEELEIKGYENTLVDEWVYGKLKNLKEQKKTFVEWRDELLYEAPKIRRDYCKAEGALDQELNRLDRLRSAARERNPAASPGQGNQESPTSSSFVAEGIKYKFETLPFGLRHLHTHWRCERDTRKSEGITRECGETIRGDPASSTSCYSSTSSAEE
ncbi:hypothetical protein QAD02_012882 [Eretmocerus hayati]|uniref:Uncharacterized protein n=1 Tax=Eretmocerus hayati TaxID=131215 RepID=A0ACC2P0L1_9HYME|nr:hypothetical protein QAD02_012882 [Eretmocerus hayati]